MTIRACPGCKRGQTTKTAIRLGRNNIALYFNCRECSSTFILKAKNWKEILRRKSYG